MKNWIIRIAVGLAVLLVMAVVVLFLSLNSLVKKGVETVGPALTKVDVKLASANLSPFSGNGELKGFVMGNPKGYTMESAFKVQEARLALRIGSLFSDTIVIDQLRAKGPEITFEGSFSENNFSRILKNLDETFGGSSAKSADKSNEQPSGPGRKFRVKEMTVEDAKINFRYLGIGGSVALPTLRIENIGMSGDGVNAAELTREIVKPLLASVIKVVLEAARDRGTGLQDLTKDPGAQIDKAAGSFKNLLKK